MSLRSDTLTLPAHREESSSFGSSLELYSVQNYINRTRKSLQRRTDVVNAALIFKTS